MELKFTKMHGCGNDYIYFNCFETEIENPNRLSVILSDRHKSIGGDGIVLICPSSVADAKMRMFNIDGSEGKMCGNAIRCVGKYLFEKGIAPKRDLNIETLSGIKHLELSLNGGEVERVRVDMGKAELLPENIPVKLGGKSVISEKVSIAGSEYEITAVSMGNPHCVVFTENVEALNLPEIGPLFENSPLFPERVNTEFVRVENANTLTMRVWERGSGETWACGTGACAAAVAACENGFCNKGENITVKLLGGDLTVNYTSESVFMAGNAVISFEGSVRI